MSLGAVYLADRRNEIVWILVVFPQQLFRFDTPTLLSLTSNHPEQQYFILLTSSPSAEFLADAYKGIRFHCNRKTSSECGGRHRDKITKSINAKSIRRGRDSRRYSYLFSWFIWSTFISSTSLATSIVSFFSARFIHLPPSPPVYLRI